MGLRAKIRCYFLYRKLAFGQEKTQTRTLPRLSSLARHPTGTIVPQMPSHGSCPVQPTAAEAPAGSAEAQGCRAMHSFKGKKGEEKNKKEGFLQQFTKLKGMPSTSVYEAQYLEEGESGNRLLMVLS